MVRNACSFSSSFLFFFAFTRIKKFLSFSKTLDSLILTTFEITCHLEIEFVMKYLLSFLNFVYECIDFRNPQ